MGIIDNVNALQQQVVGQTSSIFQKIQDNAQNAISQAFKPIDDLVGPFRTPDVTAEKVDPIDFDELIKYLEELRKQFLGIPILPNIDLTGFPALPELLTDPPTFPPVVMPGAPSLNIPTFDFVMPTDDVAVPSVTFDYTEEEYSSSLRTALEAVLLSAVQSGGYGLNADDESRLFERARDREIMAMQDAIESATRLHSAGGFPIPSGAAQQAIRRVVQDAHLKISEANRETLLKKADLYADMKKHTENASLQYEQINQALHATKMERFLKAAAQRVTSTMEIAMFALERIKMGVQRYSELAKAFESRVRAESLRVEIYGRQIDAEKAKIEANRLEVELFVETNKAIVAVFMAKADAFIKKVDAQVEKGKMLVEGFKARAAAFEAAARARTSMVEAMASHNRAIADLIAGELNAKVAAARLALEYILGVAQVRLESSKGEVMVAAGVAQAALNSLNVNASLGAQASSGAQFSGSISESDSRSTNYNYNYDI